MCVRSCMGTLEFKYGGEYRCTGASKYVSDTVHGSMQVWGVGMHMCRPENKLWCYSSETTILVCLLVCLFET